MLTSCYATSSIGANILRIYIDLMTVYHRLKQKNLDVNLTNASINLTLTKASSVKFMALITAIRAESGIRMVALVTAMGTQLTKKQFRHQKSLKILEKQIPQMTQPIIQ